MRSFREQYETFFHHHIPYADYHQIGTEISAHNEMFLSSRTVWIIKYDTLYLR